MPNRTIVQDLERLTRAAVAEASERVRLIESVPDKEKLHAELAEIRRKYNISVHSSEERELWLRSQEAETLLHFNDDLTAIREKYKIDDKLNDIFWLSVWNIHNGFGLWFKDSLPKVYPSMQSGKPVLMITPDTDIRNEYVLQFIETWQVNTRKQMDLPPQPRKIKGDRKLDWRPVWEWSLRHPQVTIKELAYMLGRNYTSVKRKLKELDNQLSITPLTEFQK